MTSPNQCRNLSRRWWTSNSQAASASVRTAYRACLGRRTYTLLLLHRSWMHRLPFILQKICADHGATDVPSAPCCFCINECCHVHYTSVAPHHDVSQPALHKGPDRICFFDRLRQVHQDESRLWASNNCMLHSHERDQQMEAERLKVLEGALQTMLP